LLTMGSCASVDTSSNAPLPLRTDSVSHLPSQADRSQKQVLPLPVPSGMPSTPMGKDKEVFKYYCPICFIYFKDIFRSSCCRNYVCENCALDHISTKSKNDEEYYTVPLTRLDGIPCPSCGSDHVIFEKVTEQEIPRSYQESPHTKNLLMTAHDHETDRSARKDKDRDSTLEVLGEGDETNAHLNQSVDLEAAKTAGAEPESKSGEVHDRERASSYALMSAMSAELPVLPHEPSCSRSMAVAVSDSASASANANRNASVIAVEQGPLALVRVETAVQEDGSVVASVSVL